MRRTFRVILLSSAFFLSLSLTAFAGELNLQFTQAKGTNANGVYTGIYNGNLGYGTPSGQSTSKFMCDDYFDHISNGEVWQVQEFNYPNLNSPVHDFTSASNFYGGMSESKAYWEALWLADQVLDHPNIPDPLASIDSFAIWTLLNKNVLSTLPNCNPNDPHCVTKSEVEIAMGLADAAWHLDGCKHNLEKCTDAVEGVHIYVPVGWPRGDGRPQEFLSETCPPPSPTPEPMSMVLMGSFLSLAGGLMRRKKRAS